MKKVLIALVAVAIASLSFAGSFQWGAMSVQKNGVAITTGFDAVALIVQAGTNMESTWTAVAGGTDIKTMASYGSSYTSTSTANIPWQTLATYDNHSAYLASTNYDVYMVVFKDNQFAYASTTVTTPAWVAENETDVNANFMVTNLTTWTNIASVPEPTALALLALGVGAIALRRKQVA